MTSATGIERALQSRLLTTASIAALALLLARGAQADDFGVYEPYPIGTDRGDWEADRADAAFFGNVGRFQGRDDVLRLGVEPPADPGSFYNWQGYLQRTQVPAGNSFLRGDMWVPQTWRRGTDTDYMRTGLWGSAMPEDLVAEGRYVDDAAVFPIVSFTNQGGVGRLEVWDPAANPDTGWVDLPETARLIDYDGWNTIELRLLPEDGKIAYVFNGEVIYTWDSPKPDDPTLGLPERFWAIYLQARNNGVTAFDTYWSRLLSGLFVSEGDIITDTPGDLVVEPAGGAQDTVRIARGATIGGSLIAEGRNARTNVVVGDGATIAGDLIGQNAAFRFGTDPAVATSINGNVALESGTRTTGGLPGNPIQTGGNVFVDDTSTLGGNWSIGGDLQVDGTLGPGNSIGVVSVGGNHSFGPGSIYEVEVNADGDADLLDAGGTATLDGTVRIIPLRAPTDFRLGHPYTIVTAGGGFGGSRFDGVTWDEERAFVEPSLSYDTNNAYVTITRNAVAFAEAAATPNQAAAASGLDSLSPGNDVYDAVALSTVAAAQEAFDALSGEIHASTRAALLDESRHLREAVTGRARDAFVAGRVSRARSGQTWSDAAQSFGDRPIPGTSARVWAHGFGSWGQLDGDSNTAKVDRDTGGVLVGVDGPVSESWRLGIAGGYGHTSLDADGRRSDATVDSYHLSAYAGTAFGPLGLRFGASHSWHEVDTSREIAVPGIVDSASADYDARTAQLFGEVGYKVDLGELRLEPFGDLAYVHVSADSFDEDGGGSALDGSKQNDDLGFSTLGIRAEKTTVFRDETRLTLRGSVGWRHAYGDVSPEAKHAFDGGTPFTVEGAPIARDAAVVKAAVELSVHPNVSVAAGYSGQIADDADDHGVTATLSVRF